MSAVIFVGPSLPTPRPTFPGLAWRPPAGSGDLARAADDGARTIGLVDGRFHQVLAVSPTEIRAVAERGVRLFGAASLGALRACDCPDVMEGVGEVWAGFRSGRLRAEDEVAEAWDPDTGRVVAWPLVSIRSTLAAMERDGRVPAATRVRAIRALRRRCYLDRGSGLLGQLLPADIARELVDRLRAGTDDVKRRDAWALVARVCASVGVPT